MRQPRWNRTPVAVTHLAVWGLALAGCGENEPSRVADFYLLLVAQVSDTTAEGVRTHDCVANGFFRIDRPVPASGTVRFPLQLNRNLMDVRGSHFENTAADTTIGEVVMDYQGLGGESLQLTLGVGPYTATLGPGSSSFHSEYTGEWACSSEVPLAQDSTLLAYGYDAGLPIVGTWRLTEVLPIE